MTLANMDFLAMPKPDAEAELGRRLDETRQFVARALAQNRPDRIKAVKDRLVQVSDGVQRSNLSRHAKDDVFETIRRTEFYLGKAIRQGQAMGTVCVKSDTNTAGKFTIMSFFSHKNEITEIYAMVDGVTVQEFEEGLARARAQNALSRANVVRQVAKSQPASVDGFTNRTVARTEKAKRIRELAEKGWSKRAAARELGIAPRTVDTIARDYGIRFDAAVAQTRLPTDSPRIVRETVNTLEGLLMALPMVKVNDLDPEDVAEWSESLTVSLRAIGRFNRKIKERLNQNVN